MMFLLLVMVMPIGVGTAIYLEEYANRERWYNRMLEVNIQNLAAVPSIVYGILGLAFIVRGLGIGRVLLAGAMILTLLVLPTVIVASREAIRAVPDSIRQGALRAGRDAVAGRLAPGPPGGDPGDRDRLDPRSGAGDRRDGAAPPGRRAHVRRGRPDDPRLLHGAAGSDLPVDHAPAGGVPTARRGRDHGAPRDPPDDERFRDLAPKPLSTTMVRDDMEISTATPARIAGVDEKAPRAHELRGLRAPRGRSSRCRPARHLRRRTGAEERLARDLQELRDGVHRAVRLRQEHVHPLLQPA